MFTATVNTSTKRTAMSSRLRSIWTQKRTRRLSSFWVPAVGARLACCIRPLTYRHPLLVLLDRVLLPTSHDHRRKGRKEERTMISTSVDEDLSDFAIFDNSKDLRGSQERKHWRTTSPSKYRIGIVGLSTPLSP